MLLRTEARPPPVQNPTSTTSRTSNLPPLGAPNIRGVSFATRLEATRLGCTKERELLTHALKEVEGGRRTHPLTERMPSSIHLQSIFNPSPPLVFGRKNTASCNSFRFAPTPLPAPSTRPSQAPSERTRPRSTPTCPRATRAARRDPRRRARTGLGQRAAGWRVDRWSGWGPNTVLWVVLVSVSSAVQRKK